MAKLFAEISSFVLTNFAVKKLGLLPPPNQWTPLGGYLGYSFAKNTAFIQYMAASNIPEGEYPLFLVDEKYIGELSLKKDDSRHFLALTL